MNLDRLSWPQLINSKDCMLWALNYQEHTLSVCQRLTGCGIVDTESTVYDSNGNYWIMKGNADMREWSITASEAILKVKQWADERSESIENS